MIINNVKLVLENEVVHGYGLFYLCRLFHF